MAAAAAIAVGALGTASVAVAAQNPGIAVANGATQPAFGYADAIRERVWVEADFDTDQDGVKDRIALDIMRPSATATGFKAPVIMDCLLYTSPSPRDLSTSRMPSSA